MSARLSTDNFITLALACYVVRACLLQYLNCSH
jgi:hypothetical protein